MLFYSAVIPTTTTTKTGGKLTENKNFRFAANKNNEFAIKLKLLKRLF